MPTQLVLLPGWWLWQHGTLQLAYPTVLGTIVQIMYLLVAVHRLSHHESLYEHFHGVHHFDGSKVHELSLFVMHPLEAVGFGSLLTALILLVPVSLPAISAFFAINLIIGTAAHLPVLVGDRKPGLVRHRLDFHGAHHDNPNSNFGFFTSLPDRLGRSGAGS